MKSPSLFAAVGLSLVLAPAMARAQSCTEDSDCDPEDYCDRYPSVSDTISSEGSREQREASSGAAGSGETPGSDEATDVEEEPVVGQCERGGRSCTSDDECLADHYCSLDQVSVATCPEDRDCPEPPPPSGRCEHEPYTCSADADCPDPAVCDDGECIYQIEPCQDDSECDAEYECLDAGGRSSDSSSSDDSASSDDPGSAGDPLPDAPSSDDTSDGSESASSADAEAAEAARAEDIAEDDPAGSEDDFRLCFPKLVTCQADDDCIDGWICAEIDDGPPTWDGVERACLPPGIDAALKGDIDVDGGGDGEDTSSDSGEQGRSEEGDEDEDDVVEMALGTQGGSEGTAPNDGCHVQAPFTQSRTPWWALALGAVAVSLRRRSLSRDGSN